MISQVGRKIFNYDSQRVRTRPSFYIEVLLKSFGFARVRLRISSPHIPIAFATFQSTREVRSQWNEMSMRFLSTSSSDLGAKAEDESQGMNNKLVSIVTTISHHHMPRILFSF
jgi:hypothetical protein